jgi:invasion protein IalB
MFARSAGTLSAGAIAAALILIATPASADQQTQANPNTAANAKDPSRIICEKMEETGSRLSARRVCMTAQQWEDRRRTDREGVENVQNTRTEPSGH